MRRWIVLIAAAALAGCGLMSGSDNRQASREARALELEPKAISSADLRRAADGDKQLARFYGAVGWRAVWDGRQATALLAALGDAPKHALSARAFLKVDPNGTPAAKELALTRAALDYGNALARGLVDPKAIREIYELPRPEPDIAAGLAKAIEAESVAEWLPSLAPQSAEYRALADAFARYSRQAEQERTAPITAGELIHVGERDPRVPQLADALAGNGYLPPEKDEPEDAELYTAAMETAVKRLQADYGIQSDGIVGPETLEVLNTSASDKARQLAVNLERLRWLERAPPATRIDVNIAAAELSYWRDGRLRDRRRVVVGQPDWETPQMQSPMFQLIANPSWTVPESIATEEILPKGGGFMAANNMVFRNGKIVQLPGPKNALGEVKFDLKNDHAIYLHDTPAKALFAANERHRSHGCVRVFDALGFARMLASEQGVRTAFERALAESEEGSVSLRREIPVRLLYRTVYLDPSGTLRFVTDAYGWDDDIAEALSLQSRVRRKLKSRVDDVGP